MHLIYHNMMRLNGKFDDFETNSCYDLASALEYVKQLSVDNYPDFIILDVDLGQGDTGWDFLQSSIVRQLPASVKIFVCTSSISIEDKLHAFQFSQVTAFYVKPLTNVNFNQILALLSHA